MWRLGPVVLVGVGLNRNPSAGASVAMQAISPKLLRGLERNCDFATVRACSDTVGEG